MLIPRVDWALIMSDLKGIGVTPYKVSLLLNVADCTARNWAKGGEPGFSIGQGLLQLHREKCGDELTISRTVIVERPAKVA